MSDFSFLKNRFVGALTLESLFPRRARKKVIALLTFATFFLIILLYLLPLGFIVLGSLFPAGTFDATLSFFASLNARFLPSLLLLCVPLLLVSRAIDAFFNSKTFDIRGDASNKNIAQRLNLYASELWWKGPRFSKNLSTQSLFAALPRTIIGSELLLRLGLDEKSYKEFVATTNEWKPLDAFVTALITKTPAESDITFPQLVTALFEEHASAKALIDSREIKLQTLRNAALWLERSYARSDTERRWWLWQNLARIPGIGKEWSYAQTPLLEQFAHNISGEARRMQEKELVGKDREIKLLESALLKDSGANAIIVGETGSGRHTVLLGLARMIAWGTIFPDLEDKRVFRLAGSSLVASGKSKGEVEELLVRLLNEAASAHNIVLAIEEFPEFVESLLKIGVNAGEILTPYLSHPSLHILAIADTLGFRKTLENNAGLMKYFERIEIAEPDLERLEEVLEDHVGILERHNKVVLTYLAIEKIAQGGTENLVQGALPKRAVDLLEEVVEESARRVNVLILPELVTELITQKTKIPLGDINKEEQDKLMHLEEFLQKRVMGQDEALKAVADAIRRARSGIKNPKRPIGSFLFLGPTGVGKTETAKAIAESYFGSEDAMLRFDMTEYQMEDGFDKLVGSLEKNEPGLLTSRMRASPYALVLLDEFEKSNTKVKNLFLQVLDEGFFTDYAGRKVNMRNTIIIATSNAGAKMIWESVEKGVDPSTLRTGLFEFIQSQGLYAPELLNRFDAVIIYHPLGRDVLTNIARANLKKFAILLASSKNITLTITEPLVEAVAKGGYDPVFGARPMQRFLQDKVEKLVADKIIKGDIKSGGTFAPTPEEVASLA